MTTDKVLWQDEIENCTKCGGIGSREITVDGIIKIVMCKCASRVLTQERIISAGIPRKLYSWDLRKLGKSFIHRNKESLVIIKKYINNIDINIRKGNGLWISSPPGLGKNSILCYIIRIALEKEYRAQFVKARKLVGVKFDAYKDSAAKTLLRKITEDSHLVALADLEKAPLYSSSNDIRTQTFYEILSDIDDSKIALLVSSNIPKLEVLKNMPSFMQARFWSMKEAVLFYTKDVHGGISHG